MDELFCFFSVSSNLVGLALDYMPVLRKSIVVPLKKNGNQGVDEVISFMNSYDLVREDIDSVMELNTWGKEADPLKDVPSNVS